MCGYHQLLRESIHIAHITQPSQSVFARTAPLNVPSASASLILLASSSCVCVCVRALGALSKFRIGTIASCPAPPCPLQGFCFSPSPLSHFTEWMATLPSVHNRTHFLLDRHFIDWTGFYACTLEDRRFVSFPTSLHQCRAEQSRLGSRCKFRRNTVYEVEVLV